MRSWSSEAEHGQAIEAVAHHQQLFARAPNLVAGDRGVHSAETEEKLKAAGVKRVAIPVVSHPSEARQALERTRANRARISLAGGHRGADCEFEARLWLAQEQVSRDGRDGTVAGFWSHCLQPAPYRPSHRGINPNERQRSAT